MSLERPDPLFIASRIQEFTNRHPSQGVNNFVLEGPIRQSSTHTLVAAALFPTPEGGTSLAIVGSVPPEPEAMARYHGRIIRLSINERIQKLGIQDEEDVRSMMATISSLNSWPISTICFAQYQQTGEDIVMMYAIRGISPQAALSEFQEKSRDRLSTLS